MSDQPVEGDIRGGVLSVPLDAVSFSVSRSSGPGGQNVNKVNTRIELRVALSSIQGLSESILQRLRMLAGKKLTAGGELRIVCQQTRSLETNRQDAIALLQAMLTEASRIPKKRHATKPSRGSKRRRLENKKRRGEVKTGRRTPGAD
jgi:ribosome-associated protein